MATLLTEAISVLGIEIGQVHTKAVLFDVVEECYHLIATGISDSTHCEPYFDIGEGIFESINRLQEVTGRIFLDHDGNLIMPAAGNFEGVDRLLICVSCGEDLKVATFGLLNDVSLESANHLAQTNYSTIIESFGINDRRPVHTQMDALLQSRPDILIVAGGTDHGASRAIARIVNLIGTTLQVLPRDERPKVLFCGNQTIANKVREHLDRITDVRVAENVRPAIDFEHLDGGVLELGKLVMEQRMRTISGLERILPLCSDTPILSNSGAERIVRFLGKQYDPEKGVLNIDLGSAHSTAVYSNGKDSTIQVLPMGMGHGMRAFLEATPVTEIQKWLPEVVGDDEILNYLWQKTLFPETVPATETTLAIELAVARLILQKTTTDLIANRGLLTKCFEPIILSGTVLTRTATPQQVLLTLLDGIQPLGITPIIIDRHGILPILGAVAKVNPLLPVQLFESTAFINLATVVTAESSVRYGNTIMYAHLEHISGNYFDAEVKQGSIVSLPLKSGEIGYLTLKNAKRTRIEDVEITSNPIRVKGGVCGVVIDARGRPISLPSEDARRRELFKRWAFLLGSK